MPYIIAFLIAGIFSITQPVLAQTWSNPLGAPPTNNAAEPINVSSNGQVKTGGFGAASLSSASSASIGGNLMVGSATAPADQISILSAGTYGNAYGKWSAFGRIFSGLPLYLSSSDYGYGTVWDSGAVFLGLNDRGATQKDALLSWGSNTTYPTNLIYKYNGSEVARMTNAGNLGLGTTTPASKLTVVGTIHSSSGGFKFPDGTTQTTAAAVGSAQWTTLGANIYNANTGNVGIGTTNPSTSLHVQGTGVSVSNTSFVSGSAGSGLAIAQGGVGDTYVRLQQYNAGGVAYGNIGLNPSGGNVGIGTTAPGNKLQVTGGNIGIGTADSGLVFYGGGEKIIGTTGYGIDFQTQSGTSRMTILNNGNIGISKTSPGYTLDVNGTAYATNIVGTTGTFSSIAANTFTYASDRNLKKNITPLESSLSKILKLDGVSFNWKTDADKAEKKIGFIAQEVEKIFPEVVSGDKIKGVEYGNLVAPLVEAVKEQQTQIESQKKEIESLKSEKQILEKRLIKVEQALGL